MEKWDFVNNAEEDLFNIETYIMTNNNNIKMLNYQNELLKKRYAELVQHKPPFCLEDFKKVLEGSPRLKKQKFYKNNTSIGMFMSSIKFMLEDVWEDIDKFKLNGLYNSSFGLVGLEFNFTHNNNKYYLFVPNYTGLTHYDEAVRYGYFKLYKENDLKGVWEQILAFDDWQAVRSKIKNTILYGNNFKEL